MNDKNILVSDYDGTFYQNDIDIITPLIILKSNKYLEDYLKEKGIMGD